MTYKAIIVVVPVIAVLLGVIPATIFAQSDNSQQQQTCSDGSQPDSNGNCPTQQQQQQTCSDGSTPDSNGNCPTQQSQNQLQQPNLVDKICHAVNSNSVSVILSLAPLVGLHIATGGTSAAIIALAAAYCAAHGG
jgi:hypothetical protein